jgi:thymidylate synthase (FAD)
MDPHAQLEIREYATAMYELVKQKLPIACEAFEDYIFKAHTFSRMEFELIKRMISKNAWVTLSEDYDRDDEYDNEGIAREFGMSKREMTEFKTKFGLK